MRKGGYQILDLRETDLTLNEPTTIDGAYDLIENANGKAVMISGLVITSTQVNDSFSIFVKGGNGDYVGVVVYNTSLFVIRVQSNDAVTVTTGNYTTATNATSDTAGLVRQIPAQDDATASEEETYPTVEEFNALVELYNNLLSALNDAGIMAGN